ncbi:MAG: DUF1189 family protein [Opitutales bacterium]|nr:DUF1189 family protein [Opitutales bacterium]
MQFFIKLFYDVNTYIKILKWNAIKVASYFIFLCILLSTSITYCIYPSIKKSYDDNIVSIKDALTHIKVVDGEIQPLVNRTIEINDADGNVYAILSSKAIDIKKLKNLVFSIEGKRFSLYQNNEEMSFNLSNLYFDKSIKNLADVIPNWTSIKYFILPLTIFFTCISICLWHILMLATFAFIVDMPHRFLRFFNSIKLAVTASTPAIIINFVYSIITAKILPESIIMVISAILLYYIVINITKICVFRQNQA